MERNNRTNRWLGGAILIVIGLWFLVQNIAGVSWGNWWALFILLPAGWSFWRAWTLYQQDHQITHCVANAVYGGLFAFAVAVIFLFNLNFGKLWPVFLIIAGVGAFFGLRADNEEKTSSSGPS
jgi:hypothetical protein